MREKGQVSIEFILIVTIALVYIYGVIWPIVDNSTNVATDIKAVADTKISAMKLANAVNEASVSSGDMKKTINIFLPEGGEITCNTGESKIDFNTMVAYVGKWEVGFDPEIMNPNPANCIAVLDSIDPVNNRPIGFNCGSSVSLLEPLQEDCPGTMVGAIFRKFVVQKTGGTVSMGWET